MHVLRRSLLSNCLVLITCLGAFAFQPPALVPGLRGSRTRTTKSVAHRHIRAPRMSLDGSMPVEQVLELASAAPAMAGMMYQKALAASPAGMDAMTGMGLYCLGQKTKGFIAKAQPSADVVARWMTIGMFDGLLSHQWYELLESVFGGMGLSQWNEVAAMTAATGILFTPLYCAGFLGGLSLLEGKGLRGAIERLQHEYVPLAKATVSTWSAFNVGLFGLVDLDHRVTVAMTAHYLYLIALALWSDRSSASTSSSSAANLLQEEQMGGGGEPGLRLAVPYQADDVPQIEGGDAALV